jgi:hypothetical protein
MAALTFTAASVLLTGGVKETLLAGGTVARGNLVRKNASQQVVVASNDSAANADAYGIALDDGASGQPVVIAVLAGGGTLAGVATNGVAGHPVYNGTSGAINPMSDGASGQFITVVGVMSSASAINLGKIAGGVAAASDIV